MATADAGVPTLEELRRAVAEALGEPTETVGDDDDLVGRGLDSMRIMLLAARWRRRGAAVTFAELVERPTLGHWWAVVRAGGQQPEPPPEIEVEEGMPFQLAPMQQAYWIGRGDDRPVGGVGAHFYAELDGESVVPDRLDRAVEAVIARHGMLRARFLEDGRQQVLSASPWRGLTVHDLRGERRESVERRLQELRAQLSQRRLDVERGEVWDVRLSLLPGDATRTHVSIEMLVSDAQSFQLVLDDLARLYLEPERPLPPIRISFARCLALQRAARRDARAHAAEYWRARLDELPGAPQLPLAVEADELSGHGVARCFHLVGPPERRTLEARARAHRITLPAVLATAFAEVLGAFSAEPRFLLNVPLFDRDELDEDVPLVVGDFTNLILLDLDLTDEAAFTERAAAVQARLAAGASHAAYSGVEVLRDLARLRGAEWLAAPVVFTSAIGMGDLFGENVRRALGRPGWTTSQTPQVWLDHQVTERDGGLLFNWDIAEGLFPPGLVDAMFAVFLRLLQWLTATPDWATVVPHLLPPAQAKVRAAVNATERPLDGRLLHGRFFDVAREHRDRPALLWGEGGYLTYGALADSALRIGRLLRERGVGEGDAVAVTMQAGHGRIAAVLGVLAAGATYVPVGLDQPRPRRNAIYENARVPLVLTRESDVPLLEWPEEIDAVAVEAAASLPPLTAPASLGPDALAYVVYTSGSTGAPKGVEMSHAAAANTIDAVDELFEVTSSDRVLAVSSLEFDLSVYDVFGLLSIGGAVVLVEEPERREARRWADLVRRHGVTIWNSVPALLEMLLTAAPAEALSSLRLALVSGDWISPDLAKSVAAACPACRLVALGGATEAAIWSNTFEVGELRPEWRSIPYGRPLPNQKYRVVDPHGRDRPDLVPGELWIGGRGLANGYRGAASLTAERFVERDGERWYRTGDLGRYRPDGTLEFLGRADLQVKIHGHRVELGEVEAACVEHPQVSRAAATTVGGAEPRLAVAVTPTDGGSVDAAGLRMFVAARLPAHMVPAEVVTVAELPLNANGKIDRRALAEIVAHRREPVAGEDPRGDVETSIASLWAELLGVERVPRDRRFLELGGDSLLATRLVEELRQRFAVEISLRRFFAAPTVADLASLVAAARVEEGVL